MSRKTGNAQSRLKFFRHVAVLLRKVPSYCNRTEWSTINSGSYRASNFKSAERVARGRFESTRKLITTLSPIIVITIIIIMMIITYSYYNNY